MKYKACIIYLLALLQINLNLFAQNKQWNFFPVERNFPLLEYDLNECHIYSGMHILRTEFNEHKGVYIPVNLGVSKVLLGYNYGEYGIDLGLEAASYTQFEVIEYSASTLRGGLLNIDFKASGYIGIKKNRHRIRLRIFHISSHMGDDYMLRNDYFEPNDKTVNYEQIDLTYLYKARRYSAYFGLGENISPNTFRKRFMLQLGTMADYPINRFLAISGGADIKIQQENQFFPDIHISEGISVYKNMQKQASFLIDFYSGHIPFSTLKFGKVYWFGISTVVFL